ncbi:MAG: amidohydrolase [Spirochaetes bacterium]|nr:amidohydrolase [Spirochaetota bacterium]
MDKKEINNKNNKIEEYFFDLLVSIRRSLHRIPEPSLKEFNTANYIISILEENKIEYRRISETGIIAYIEGNNKEPLLCFRADMDALPIKEETNLDFTSKNDGYMHACGHDFHMSIILNLAIYFKNHKPDSSLLFIFQPGEEGSGGAQLMLNCGLWEIFGKPEAIFGFHVWPSLETGYVAFCEGEAWAGSVEFLIKLKGKGGHGAYPHETSDLVSIFSDWYLQVQNFITRKIEADELALITCGKISGANKSNIIPSVLEIGGTLRYFKDEIKERILIFSKEYLENLSKLYGAESDFLILSDYIPIVNDFLLSKKLMDFLNNKKNIKFYNLNRLNLPKVKLTKKVMVADDISYFIRDIGKGIYFFLGVKNPGLSILQSLHTKDFNPDESALKYGFEFFKFLVDHYNIIF